MTQDDLFLTVLASPAIPGLARTLIAQRLTKWSLSDILDNVLIVASELLANAVDAAPGAELRLHLRRIQTPSGVLFRVWDPSPSAPLPRPATALTLAAIDAAPDAAWDHGGGWGLPLVQALSAACGHTPTPPRGKWVWSRLTL